MDRVEATGRTVNEAVEHALVRLACTREQVDIEVLSEGSRGILGIGAEDARVVVTVRGGAPAPILEDDDESALQAGEPAGLATTTGSQGFRPARERGPASRRSRPPVAGIDQREAVDAEPTGRPIGAARPPSGLDTLPRRSVPALEGDLPEAELADEPDEATAALAVASDELVDTSVGVLMELLELLRVEGEVEVRSRSYPLTLNVHGDDLGILIGRHGDTLASLQFMVNLIVGRRMGRWTRVVVDVEEYRQRRERTLRDVAARTAERVRRMRQSITLEPMPANERRIVHMTLQGDRFVSTHSVGEGDSRKVVISPRGR
jgi:spoIIIJ-associated protein